MCELRERQVVVGRMVRAQTTIKRQTEEARVGKKNPVEAPLRSLGKHEVVVEYSEHSISSIVAGLWLTNPV